MSDKLDLEKMHALWERAGAAWHEWRSDDRNPVRCTLVCGPMYRQWIEHCITDMPRLIAEVKKLREEKEASRG